MENAQKELNDTKELIKTKSALDKEIQVDTIPDNAPNADNVDNDIEADNDANNTKTKDDVKKEEEVFVYPSSSTDEQKTKDNNTDEEDEDDEVFVYRGMDAVAEFATAATSELAIDTAAEKGPQKIYDEDDILKREAKMKNYYEQRLESLIEKIQMTDSKAFRFAAMYKSLKDRLIKEDNEKQMMVTEIERLNKEVKNVQDLLTTTESNYQKQVDTMTEFISSLQQNQEEQSRHHQQQPPQRRSNNYHNQR